VILDQIMDLSESHRELASSLRKERSAVAVEHHDALTDQLTGLGNRRQMEESLDIEIERAKRNGTDMGVLMADLDHFKRVNDEYGHTTGDIVLKSFARLIKESIRPFDVATRFGGEEFVVHMPGASSEDALKCAERIRASVEQFAFTETGLHITSSFGVTAFREDDTKDSLINRVDAALYEAKETGRNRVCVG